MLRGQRGFIRRRSWASAAILAVVLSTLSWAGGSAHLEAAGRLRSVAVSDQPVVPSEVPADTTPRVGDGEVDAIVQLGSEVILGGSFTTATPAGKSTAVPRGGLLAFDPATGALSDSFTPAVNGTVDDLEPGPLPGTVYVAGAFSTLNGAKSPKVLLLDASTGQQVAGFRAAAMDGEAASIALSGGSLYVGGFFATVGGAPHAGIAALDPLTGAVLPGMDIQVATRHEDGVSGANVGRVGVRSLDVSADGGSLVVIGDFQTADGLPRQQIFMADLTGAGAVVRTDWRTRRYEPGCYYWAFDSYMRTVSFSPDGTWFAVTATGGGNPGTLCDSVTRWETAATGDDVQPTWVDYTGGDTLWGLAISRGIVYVGGHQRWMNNSSGQDSAGQGSVPRPGLAALSATTGMPVAWNPGRNPRGEAAYVVYAGTDALFVGSDTEYIGNRTYYRPRIAMFPYAGGRTVVQGSAATLPADVLVVGSRSSSLDLRSFDGTTLGTARTVSSDGWDTAHGGFYAGGRLWYGGSDGLLHRRTWDGRLLGPATTVDPYRDPAWVGVDTGSGNTYDGKLPSVYSQFGSVQGMAYADGRIYWARSSSSTLSSAAFDPDSGVIGSVVTTVSSAINFRNVGGMFVSGGYLYYVGLSGLSGQLYRIAFDGRSTSGAAQLVSSADWRSRALFLAPTFVNQPPVAAVSATCSDLTCTFDAAGSTDPDGTIADIRWDFGDGSTADGATVQHTYTAGGSYQATVTVVDDLGGSDTRTIAVDPSDPQPSAIVFGGSSQAVVNATSATVAPPAGATPGDVQVLSVSAAAPPSVEPAGWTPVSSTSSSGLWSGLYARTAGTADTGTTIGFSAITKAVAVMVDYADASVGGATSATDAATAVHVSPTMSAPSGAWVVSLWSDKSSSTTAWTPPDGLAVRAAAYGAGSGRVTTLVGDSAGPVPNGTVGGLTATTDAASSRGVAWTLTLLPLND